MQRGCGTIDGCWRTAAGFTSAQVDHINASGFHRFNVTNDIHNLKARNRGAATGGEIRGCHAPSMPNHTASSTTMPDPTTASAPAARGCDPTDSTTFYARSCDRLKGITMTTDIPAVQVQGLVKNFGETAAVDGVDLSIAQGGIYGVLGPNGAGKTTVMRMLATLLRPDAGEAKVLGHDVYTEPQTIREKIALTGQFASLDEDLTGIENLILLGRLLGYKHRAARKRGMDLLEAFGLTKAANRPVKKYSGGMRRRLDIAGSLIVTP